MVFAKISYPENLIKLKRPTPSYYIDETISCGKFQKVKLRYVQKQHYEAMADPYQNRIDISDKFFDYNQSARKHILRHELGHFYETDIFSGKPSYFWKINDSGIFGSGKVTRNGGPYFSGVNGTYNLNESVAESFAMYFSSKAAEFKKQHPEAYKFCDEYVKNSR